MKMVRSKKEKTKKKFDPMEAHAKYLEKIESELEDGGVVMFDDGENLHIDRDYLDIPPDITTLSSQDIGNTLNAFTQQKMYLRTILNRAENIAESARRAYYSSSASLYSGFTEKKMSETAKERMINSDEEVRPLYEFWLDKKRQVCMIESSIENIEDAIFLLSREVTRRGSDYDEENRSYNVGKR